MSYFLFTLQPHRSGASPVTEHVVIINRWREHYADYAQYVDHKRNVVSYITTTVGLAAVPPRAAAIRTVGRRDDTGAVRTVVDDLAMEYGAPTRIIALKEDDLLVAATLREEWGVRDSAPTTSFRSGTNTSCIRQSRVRACPSIRSQWSKTPRRSCSSPLNTGGPSSSSRAWRARAKACSR